MCNIAVEYHNGVQVLTSQNIAAITKRGNHAILQIIKNIKCDVDSANFNENFIKELRKNKSNQTVTCYLMTRKGCKLIAEKLGKSPKSHEDYQAIFSEHCQKLFTQVEGSSVSGNTAVVVSREDLLAMESRLKSQFMTREDLVDLLSLGIQAITDSFRPALKLVSQR